MHNTSKGSERREQFKRIIRYSNKQQLLLKMRARRKADRKAKKKLKSLLR